MATYRVFNLKAGEWLNVESTTVRKALLKAIEQSGQPVDGAEIKTATVNGNHLATLGDFAIRLSARRVVNGFYVE